MHLQPRTLKLALWVLAVAVAVLALKAFLAVRPSFPGRLDPVLDPEQAALDHMAVDSESPKRASEGSGHASGAPRASQVTAIAACDVEVLEAETGRPSARVRVTAWVDAGARQVGDPVGVLTNEAGHARLDVPTGLPLILIAHGDHRSHSGAHADVPALARDEVRGVTLRVHTQPDVHVVGRVVRRTTKDPIAGVVVSARSPDDPATTEIARTRTDGSFEASVRSFAVDALRFDHADYGIAFWLVPAALPSSTVPVEILLDPAGALVVTLSRLDDSSRTFDVTVAAAVGDLLQPRGSPIGGEADEVRSSKCLQGGKVELRPLTPLVPLVLDVRAGAEIVWRAPAPIVLQPGEVRSIEVVVNSLASIEGQVTEQDGALVVGAEVLLRRGVLAGPLYLGSLPSSGVEIALTNELGMYRFAGVPAGLWRIGPAPVPSSKSKPETDPSPVLLPIEIVEGDSVRRHDIVLRRGLFVSGLVMRPDGAPAAGASVEGYSEALSGAQETRCDGAGHFVLGPLDEGRWTLRARAFGYGESDPMESAPGARDVVLTLRSEGRLEVTAFGIDGLPLVGADVTAMRADGRGEARSTRTRAGGRAVLSELPLVPHDVVVTSGSGEIGIEREIDLGSGIASRIEMHLKRAGRARVRFDGPGSSAILLVSKDRVLLQVLTLSVGQSVDVIGPVGSVEVSMQALGSPPARTHIDLDVTGGSEHGFDGTWK